MAIVPSLPFNLQNGQLADASQVMANFNDILNGVNANAAANGANNDITALLALTTPIGPSTGGGSHDYYGGVATGTANAIVVATTLLPVSGFTLTAGKTLWFMASATNTGATQLNAVGSGLTNILKQSPSGLLALSGGEIVIGQLTGVTFDGTQYELLNNPISAIGVQTTLASAATTDLGTVPTHNILITGTVTITAFGSTAIASLPFYLVGFNGSLLLTHNGTSLILPGALNIQTAAGDFALVMYLGGGNWRVVSYNKASGLAVVSRAPLTVRQTTLSGSLDASGFPNFLPATSVNLNLTSQNDNTTPRVVAAANGFDANGSVDLIGVISANQTWTGLTASQTNYLFETVNADGTCTVGFTILPPIYQRGGTISVAAGQYTFDIAQMKMFLGNGATAPQVNVVFVGEAVTSGSAVTSTVAYAYRGDYDSGFTATLPGVSTTTTKNANLGTPAETIQFTIENTTTEFNYAVGDRVNQQTTILAGGTTIEPLPFGATRNTIFAITGGASAFVGMNKTTSASVVFTAANWKWKMRAQRGW